MKIRSRILALGLTCVLAVGLTATVAVAGNDKAKDTAEANTVSTETEEETKTASTSVKSASADADAEPSKDEIVYVLAGNDGSVQKIIVSDWLKNAINEKEITDKSELTDINNVKGDESYSVNSDDMKVWDAEGNDIYYNGNIEKELPVDVSVSYKLDGKTISAEDLAGKSGKVTIRFDYKNNQYEKVDVDGKEEKIYVPFAMLTGMLLDSNNFSNVDVTNGKVLNDGSHTAVIGFAFPGLQDNLQMDADKLEIPGYVEITADVTDFKLGMTVTVATNELFSQFDTKDIDSLDDLTDSLDKLTDAMKELCDGSSKLYDGLETLLDKSEELVSGVNQLYDGSETLANGAASIDAATSQVISAVNSLSAGLNTLDANSDTLAGGAENIFVSLLATAESQLNDAGLSVPHLTISNYSSVLTGVINSIDSDAVYSQALAAVTQAVEAKRADVEAGVTAVVKAQVEAEVEAGVRDSVTQQVTEGAKTKVTAAVIQQAAGMSVEDYNKACEAGMVPEEQQQAINEAIDAQMADASTQDNIAQTIEATMQSEEVQQKKAALLEQNMASEKVQGIISSNVEAKIQELIAENMAGAEVQAKLDAAAKGVKTVSNLKTSLDQVNAFYVGVQNYTAGVSQAADGANKLLTKISGDFKDGTSKLNQGASDLKDGIGQLKDKTPALVDGVTQLRDGALKLSDGLKQFDEEGVQKLVDAVDGDIAGLISRINATMDVSKNYHNFSGISDDMSGKVTFIYRTDEVGEE